MKRRLEYFEQRMGEGTYDLYETVSNYQRVMMAKAIDVVFFTAGLTLIIWVLFTTHWLPNLLIGALVLFYVGFYVLLKAILKGRTFGTVIMGIRFVNIKTKKQVTFKEYLQYIRKSARLEIKYSQIFQYYLKYDQRFVQNTPMKKFGMVLVDCKRYDKFYKEYLYNIKQYNQLKQQLA